MAAAFLVLDGATEAHIRDGASAQSRRAGPGRRLFRPGLHFRVHPRRDVRLPNRRDNAGPRRARRPDHQPPRKRTARPTPPCGKRGARPCPGRIKTATPIPPCGIRRAGHRFRPCPGGGRNPLVAIPVPGSGDGLSFTQINHGIDYQEAQRLAAQQIDLLRGF